MADSTHYRSGGGCFSKLVFILLLVAVAGLGTAIYQVAQPQELTPLIVSDKPPRDVKTVLKNALDRGFPVTLQEAELNQWLAHTLTVKQGGPLGETISLDRVAIRLEDGYAEIIMERHFQGMPFTVSMFLKIDRMEGAQGAFTEIQLHGGPFHPDFPNPPRGGRFGKLVVPQGFLILVMPAYEKLAALFTEEIELGLRQMSRITLEKGRVTLDPREPLGQQGMPQTF